MDIFSVQCPNLRAFKRLLLGRAQTPDDDFSLESQIDQALTRFDLPLVKNAALGLPERQLALVLLRAAKDAALDMQAKLTVLVHAPEAIPALSLPSAAKASGLAIDLQSSSAEKDDFSKVLMQALDLLQSFSTEHVALCSFFHSSHAAGLACMLLSKQPSKVNAYAQLVTGENGYQTNTHDHIEKYDLTQPANTEAQLQSVPIVKLMQSALSLNNRTRFPQPEQYTNGEQPRMRPWFPLPYADKHECLLNLPDYKNLYMQKDYQSLMHPDGPFVNFGLHLLPLAFADQDQAMDLIQRTLAELAECNDLEQWIKAKIDTYTSQQDASYALAILGSSIQELTGELERALDGLPTAFKKDRDWQTPSGSCFTPNPLGTKAKVAFVYPGAFGTYVGMGRQIFYLFPSLYEALQEVTEDPAKTINEDVIFPKHLTPELQEELQAELNDNPTEMISSGVCFSHLYTVILRDIFKIDPQAVFGYSLGENSMMFATGLWSQADGMRTSLEASPIFHQRVSGRQNAIREFWGLPTVQKDDPQADPIWANYVLMARVEKVQAALQDEEHVYLTHINTPRQVVIGGEPQACQRVVKTLNCMHLQAPYHHAIHCAPIASERDDFTRMHDWPVEYEPDIPVYSAADYAPLKYDSQSIAESFAKMLTHPIDFPRLVNLAYQDGARVFIELGAGSNCSKWIEGILKGKPFASVSINQNNVADHAAVLKMLARLVSQRIPLDLTALEGYSHE